MSFPSNIINFNSEEELDISILEEFKNLDSNKFSNVIFSGGQSPKNFYKSLSKSNIDWTQYLVTISDERDVNINDPLSNEGVIKSIINNELFNQSFIGLRDEDIEEKLRKISTYDLSILGMGLDGHFASIFPAMTNIDLSLYGSDSLINVSDGFPDVPRISMTLNEIKKSKKVILIIKDNDKFNLLNTKKNKLLPVDILISTLNQKLTIYNLLT